MLDKLIRNPTWEPIIKSASAATVNRLFSICIRLFTIPLLINHLGAERFGLWMTISAVSAYIMLLDMGISSAMINIMTEYYTRKEYDKANSYLTSVLIFLCAMACIGALMTFLFVPIINWAHLFKLTTIAAINDVHLTIVFAIVIFFMQLPFALIQKIPYTMQNGYLSELYALLANVFSLLGMLLGVYVQAGLPFLLVFINGTLIFAPIGIFAHLYLNKLITLKLKSPELILADVKGIRRKGVHFLLMQAAGMLLVALPFTLIAYYRGAEAVTPFGLLYQVLIASQVPLTVFLQPMWTKMTQLIICKDYNTVRCMFNNYLKVAVGYSIITTLLFIFIVDPVLAILIKSKVVLSANLKLLFAIWCALGVISGGGVGSVVLAMNLTSQMSNICVIQLLVFMISAVILIPLYGSSGAVGSIILTYIVTVPAIFMLVRKHLFVGSSANSLPTSRF
jgi:O-antigen/teichoic acid export membrane protein